MRFVFLSVALVGPVLAQDAAEPVVPAETPAPAQTPVRRPVSTRTGPQATQPVNVAPATNTARSANVGVIDFQGTALQAVLDYYASVIVRRSLIQAPDVPAKQIWFQSKSDLTIEEAKAALDTVFSINGIALVPLGEKFLKVVQIQTAKQEGLPFIGEARPQTASDALMTQVISLKYAEPADVVAALTPYAHASYGQPVALPKSNCILITETPGNINQMLEILKYIDVPSPLRMETRIFTLKHAKSADVVSRLQSIVQETQNLGARASAPTPVAPPPPVPGVPGSIRPPTTANRPAGSTDDSMIEGKVIISADERTNKIFILSRASNFAFFEKMILELDAKVEPDVIVKVVNLQYATAEEAASQVNALISGGSPSYTSRRSSSSSSSSSGRSGTVPAPPPVPVTINAAAGGSGTDTGFLQFAQGVRILPDPRTNALLVMATKEDMARIEELIRSIDIPVAQVQIEVVIAEVSLDNELDIGVNVFKRLFEEGQTSQIGGTGTGQPTPIHLPRAGGIGSVASLLTSNLPTAAALGSGGLTYFATFHNLKMDVVLHALHQTSRGKVLSTPVIQTMDNQEASIISGKSIPVPVSTVNSVVGNTGTVATGQLNANIEYKDVAVELKVTPRINPDGYVRMDIEQKVNDVLGDTSSFSVDKPPTITKREAKSSVAVQDQSTIVLGGLIQESKNTGETKVPFFGDIPFFGHLFKSKSSRKLRDELIIFIRPTVLRSDREAVAEAKRRSQLLNMSGELELERQFKSGTSKTATQQAPVVESSYSSKMDALQNPQGK